MDKPCWAESLQPRGVYFIEVHIIDKPFEVFKGFVDDTTATVERYKAETLTTFGTWTSKLSHDDPERLVSPANT